MKKEIEKSEYDRLKSREEKYLAYMDMLSYRGEDKTYVDALCGKVAQLEEENKKLRDEVKDLVERNIELDKKYMLVLTENKKLKSDLDECQCSFGFESDECEFWKREMKKHKPCLIKEEYVFNLGDYDYMILTSTTPQLKIIKKNNKGISTFTVK